MKLPLAIAADEHQLRVGRWRLFALYLTAQNNLGFARELRGRGAGDFALSIYKTHRGTSAGVG